MIPCRVRWSIALQWPLQAVFPHVRAICLGSCWHGNVPPVYLDGVLFQVRLLATPKGHTVRWKRARIARTTVRRQSGTAISLPSRVFDEGPHYIGLRNDIQDGLQISWEQRTNRTARERQLRSVVISYYTMCAFTWGTLEGWEIC